MRSSVVAKCLRSTIPRKLFPLLPLDAKNGDFLRRYFKYLTRRFWVSSSEPSRYIYSNILLVPRYFQRKIGFHLEDRSKTTFSIPNKHYQWKVLPFSLKTTHPCFNKQWLGSSSKSFNMHFSILTIFSCFLTLYMNIIHCSSSSIISSLAVHPLLICFYLCYMIIFYFTSISKIFSDGKYFLKGLCYLEDWM